MAKKVNARFKASPKFSDILLKSRETERALEEIMGSRGLPHQRALSEQMKSLGIHTEFKKSYSRHRVLLGIGSDNPAFIKTYRGNKKLREAVKRAM